MAALLALAGAALVGAVPLQSQDYPLTTEPGDRPWNPIEPLQQRLAFVNATAMAVSWNTYQELADDEAVVYFGLDPLNLDRTASSRQTTFETSRTFSHHAVLGGLEPKTTYHYRVAHTNCLGCSTLPTYTFTTPREPGDCEAYTIAVVADMGLMGPEGLTNVTGKGAAGALLPDETNAVQSLAQSLDAFEHIIHVGDLAYADYFLKESVQGFFGPDKTKPTRAEVVDMYEQLNEAFYDQITPLTANKAYMVAVGNHESNCDNGGVSDKANNITYTAAYCMPGQTNFTAYDEHWAMPGKDGPTQNFWYSYDDGMVHYVILNFETDFGEGIYGPDEVGGKGKQMSGPRGKVGEQIEWLKNDLKNVDRSKTPWVLAFGHRPYYVGIGDARCTQCQEAFEPIFYENKVDVVITGHDHIYSRSVPVYNNTATPGAPVYITNGLGGHYDGMDKLDNPLPANIEFGIDGVYGWSRLTFENSTTMKHEFIAARNSSVMDTFYVVRERDDDCVCGAGGGSGDGEGEGGGHGHGHGHGHGGGHGDKDHSNWDDKDDKDCDDDKKGKDDKGHGKGH